jgi:predicted enzyme related to lactoylglutathione lyase
MLPAAIAGVVLYAADFTRLSTFYSRLLGFTVLQTDTEHVLLRSAAFELVILTTAQSGAIGAEATRPPSPRTHTAIKPVFYVADLAAARVLAGELRGGVNAAGHEWRFQDCTVCDGFDPEGNIFQLRRRTSNPGAVLAVVYARSAVRRHRDLQANERCSRRAAPSH